MQTAIADECWCNKLRQFYFVLALHDTLDDVVASFPNGGADSSATAITTESLVVPQWNWRSEWPYRAYDDWIQLHWYHINIEQFWDEVPVSGVELSRAIHDFCIEDICFKRMQTA